MKTAKEMHFNNYDSLFNANCSIHLLSIKDSGGRIKLILVKN
ncbi:MAG: hypothetical protein AAB326_07170 [Pseudomonadota bacterium]